MKEIKRTQVLTDKMDVGSDEFNEFQGHSIK